MSKQHSFPSTSAFSSCSQWPESVCINVQQLRERALHPASILRVPIILCIRSYCFRTFPRCFDCVRFQSPAHRGKVGQHHFKVQLVRCWVSFPGRQIQALGASWSHAIPILHVGWLDRAPTQSRTIWRPRNETRLVWDGVELDTLESKNMDGKAFSGCVCETEVF